MKHKESVYTRDSAFPEVVSLVALNTVGLKAFEKSIFCYDLPGQIGPGRCLNFLFSSGIAPGVVQEANPYLGQ